MTSSVSTNNAQNFCAAFNDTINSIYNLADENRDNYKTFAVATNIVGGLGASFLESYPAKIVSFITGILLPRLDLLTIPVYSRLCDDSSQNEKIETFNRLTFEPYEDALNKVNDAWISLTNSVQDYFLGQNPQVKDND